jgi:hypothetical protein
VVPSLGRSSACRLSSGYRLSTSATSGSTAASTKPISSNSTTSTRVRPSGKPEAPWSGRSTEEPSPSVHRTVSIGDSRRVGLSDSHGDWKLIGESVLIDRLTHSAEWDWLLINTWIDHARQFEICIVVGSALSGASPVAMFLLIKNWFNMLSWLSK